MTAYRKITLRPSRQKPHIVPWYNGTWKCYSHNASAVASRPDKALAAWGFAQRRFERMQESRDIAARAAWRAESRRTRCGPAY